VCVCVCTDVVFTTVINWAFYVLQRE